MPPKVVKAPPALKRGQHVMNRPEAQVAKKPVAPMRVVPVYTKPPAVKRGQHVCKCQELTTEEIYDPLASEAAANACFLHKFVSFAGVYPGLYVYVVTLFNKDINYDCVISLDHPPPLNCTWSTYVPLIRPPPSIDLYRF